MTGAREDSVCVEGAFDLCVHVCVRERERDRGGENEDSG